MSRLERPDCRRRGGGGGGGIPTTPLMLSLETAREALRGECLEDVRVKPEIGTDVAGCDSSVVRREGVLGEATTDLGSPEDESALVAFVTGRVLP